MQGKALAALLLSLGALALWGCGRSDEGAVSTGPTGTRSSSAKETDDVRRAEREQQLLEKDVGTASRDGDPGGPPAVDPRPRWLKHHHDSGGGVAQFEVKDGDNSLQDYGAEAGSTEREEAAAALHAFLDARAARQWAAACAYLSVGALAALEQIPQYAERPDISGCPEILGALGSEAAQRLLREGAVADVGALRVEDNRGFVLYHGAGGHELVMPMAREDGSWKVGTIEPVPLGA